MEDIQDRPWRDNDRNARFKIPPPQAKEHTRDKYTESKNFSLAIMSTMSSCTYLYSYPSPVNAQITQEEMVQGLCQEMGLTQSSVKGDQIHILQDFP